MATKPWNRRKSESESAWAAFTSYRNQLPPRRIFAVRIHGLAVDAIQVAEWFRSHTWKERCVAYDSHLDDIRLEAKEKALAVSVQDITARHVGMLAETSEIVQAELSKLKEKVSTGAISGLKALELIKLLELQVKLDRLVAGEVTERLGTDYDYSRLSDEQMVKLTELLSLASPKDK